MKNYGSLNSNPKFSPIIISTFLGKKFTVEEQKGYEDYLWSCGKHHILFENHEEVILRENRDSDFFVCPLKLPWKPWFPWIKIPCLEKLRGMKRSNWEQQIEIYD